MKIALVALGLMLTGCAHTRVETPKTAQAFIPAPCQLNTCGKTVEWETL